VSVVSFIGTLTALPVALTALLMVRRPSIRRSAFGVLSGAGLLLLYIAWLHRDGEYLNPFPWLVIGSASLVAGIAGHAVREQRTE
jgi:drug/metabolite transporter (DMT)-like permease